MLYLKKMRTDTALEYLVQEIMPNLRNTPKIKNIFNNQVE